MNNFTKKQLISIIQNEGLNIKGYSKMNKAGLIQAIQIHRNIRGAGFLDLFRSPQKKFNNTSTLTLKHFANEQIQSLIVMRAPINRMVDKAMNIISFGAFNRFKQQSRYDSLFHLGLIVSLVNGTKLIVEKNSVVNINPKFTIERGAQFLDVPMTHRCTLKELVDNTLNYIGSDNFFLYDGLKRNCQDFLLAVLKSNQFDTPESTEFIKQDLTQLTNNISPITRKVMNGVTSLGARFDKAIGNGKVKRGKSRIRK